MSNAVERFTKLFEGEQKPRTNIKWPFKDMKPGQFMEFHDAATYQQGLGAMRQIARRFNWLFIYEWDSATGTGVIGRKE